MKNNTKQKRREIRILNPDLAIFNKVTEMAKRQKRSVSKQGEVLLAAGIKSLSNLELAQ